MFFSLLISNCLISFDGYCFGDGGTGAVNGMVKGAVRGAETVTIITTFFVT